MTEIKLTSLNENSVVKEVVISTLGATVLSIKVQGGDGLVRDVVLGYKDTKTMKRYMDEMLPKGSYPYLGATIGPFCNRVKDGKFTLDGKVYELEKNLQGNCLHSGSRGNWAQREWKMVARTANSCKLILKHEEGDLGFPGDLLASVEYEIGQREVEGRVVDELIIGYEVELGEGGSKVGICNLTNHSYFNLSGMEEETVMDHVLAFPTKGAIVGYLLQDGTGCPTGEIVRFPMKGGDSMEFSGKGEKIGDMICNVSENNGYDHCYVVDVGKSWEGKDFEGVVKLTCPTSGIFMTVRTQDPGMQIYCGNFLDQTIEASTITSGVEVKRYGTYGGICFECSKFTSAVTHPEWASQVVIRKGGNGYRGKTAYGFGVRE